MWLRRCWLRPSRGLPGGPQCCTLALPGTHAWIFRSILTVFNKVGILEEILTVILPYGWSFLKPCFFPQPKILKVTIVFVSGMNLLLSNLDNQKNMPNLYLDTKLWKVSQIILIKILHRFLPSKTFFEILQKTCFLDLLKNSISLWVFCT